MNEVEKIALAALLHDIGKFAQRAEVTLREPFKSGNYGYKHANYTAQILQDLFNDIQGYHQSAFEHHIVGKNSALDSWIVATADRLASGFEREKFENYNSGEEKEDFKTQRLRGLFDESNEYRIAKFDVENIFYAKEKAKKNEYISLWEDFVKDLKTLRETNGNLTTDLVSLDYLLRRYATFIPSATTFKKGDNTPVKANIPLYDHLKATAIFAAAISKLDNAKKENLINYYKKSASYNEQKEFILINGDFFGIQNFIFNEVETKSAAKVLRGKSAFVQLLTKIVALHIVDRLGLSQLSVVSESAGKFEILAPNNEGVVEEITNIQRELNEYFAKEFFAETGIGLTAIECGLFDFILDGAYKKLRDNLAKKVELTKLKKFDLIKSEYDIEWEKDLANQNQCFACKKRIGKEREDIGKPVCDSCYRFIQIGKNLAAKKRYLIINKNGGIPIFKNYFIAFVDEKEEIKAYTNNIAIYDISKNRAFDGFAKWELSSYVASEDEKILSFEDLAKRSVKEGVKEDKRAFGIEALMSLKGDVDNMGLFLQESDVTASFAKFNFFSRMIDYFFSVYVPHLMQQKYPDTYTIFAGGDDLFVLGAWDEVIGLAREVRNNFLDFAKGSSLTFSVGMVLAKSNKPVNFIAKRSEKALENSKNMEGKDAITLFDESVKWKEYLNDNGLKEELKFIDENTAMFYRLLNFVELSKKVKKGDPTAAIWKSKLKYTFARNMDLNNANICNFVSNLNQMIEESPKVTKMYLNEAIYKRRKA